MWRVKGEIMEIATLSSKGQITIPKTVREALGLKYGDKVVIQQEDNGRFYFDNAAYVTFLRKNKQQLNKQSKQSSNVSRNRTKW